MAGAKETPRQRMIAMMYLVLTALLAINVSKEVIDAFLVVNESVEMTNEKYSQKLERTYATFEKMYQLNQTEVRPFWMKAKEAKSLSLELIKYIENLRDELISITEGISIDSAEKVIIRDLRNKDNYSVTTQFFMGDSHDGSEGESSILKERIVNYKKKMIDLIALGNQAELKLGLITDSTYYNADGKEQNWEAHHFYNTILAADITILNKFITEVYDVEFEVVNNLMNAINADDFSYDKIDAKVLANANYLFIGDEYKAEIIVAAYDTSQSPEVYMMKGIDSMKVSQIGNATFLKGEDGKTTINLPAQQEGLNKYAGIISVKTAKGAKNYYHFSNEFIVAKPSVTVSVEEMNVLYIGVKNTVSISAPGISKKDLIPSISMGTIKPDLSGEKWIVEVPPEEAQALITVSAIINGSKKKMGTQKFRIKRLPDPIATIANKKGGFIDRGIIIAAGAIVPKMPDDFEFDLYFEIQSFEMTMQRGYNVYNYKSENALLTNDMIEQIEMTNRGQKILFDNIIAKGPYGDIRLLSPIIISIN